MSHKSIEKDRDFTKLPKEFLLLTTLTKNLSPSAKKIYKIHKLFDQMSGGYINGQEFLVLLLVTAFVPIPVGFIFYRPDPIYSSLRKTR